MRPPKIALAGLFLSTLMIGCGASTTIPAPPSTATNGPPPGSSADMTKAPKKGTMGTMGAGPPARPPK